MKAQRTCKVRKRLPDNDVLIYFSFITTIPERNAIAGKPMFELVGFDADDTLWRSQDYFDDAQARFEAIVGRYVDLADAELHDRTLATERRNIKLFGYGVKGMVLSMIETAVAITDARISAGDIHRLVDLGKEILQHPVELLPGVRTAVEAVAEHHPLVLITKGDLFHQEAKVRASGLSELFHRIEIVSEKDPPTYARVLGECGVAANAFVMVGNSLRSDIAPVLALGGYGVHVPYYLTWAREAEADLGADVTRLRTVSEPVGIAAAIRGFSG